MSVYKVKLVDGSSLEKVETRATAKVRDSIIKSTFKVSAKDLAIMKKKSGLRGNVTQQQIVQGYLKACLNEC